MENNQLIFKKNAKTFYLASLFFSKQKQKEVEILYNFCRYVDDLGDLLLNEKKSKKRLDEVIKSLKKKESNVSFVCEFIKLMKQYNIKTKIPVQLVEGVLSDLNNVYIKNNKELFEYSYRVAGTVGLMMCSLMNINEKRLFKHAIELGIAMQLTNIARDVREDLEINRIYIPNLIILKNVRDYKKIIIDKEIQKKVSSKVIKLIEDSEKLYNQAAGGIIDLPINFRFVILFASNLYREIGKQILKEPLSIWEKRVYITKIKKVIIFFRTMIGIIAPCSVKEGKKINVGYLLDKFRSG